MGAESKCPVMSGPDKHKMSGSTANQHWWPNQLNLKALHQNPPQASPMGDDFDYAAEFATVDLAALKKDIEDASVYTQIARDRQEAAAANLSGTPTIYINGRLYLDEKTPEKISAYIRSRLAKDAAEKQKK